MAQFADLTTVEKAVRSALSLDYSALIHEVSTGEPLQVLDAVEQVTKVLQDLGVPYAAEAHLAEVVLGLVIKGYQDGVIRSADPTDPSMQKAEGPRHGTMAVPGQNPLILPGGTPDDPYGFETGHTLPGAES